MEIRSIYKYARISPKKARDVAREIQGLPVSEALDTLNFTPKKAAFLIGKTLKSAVANAENNHDLSADTLHVKEANISEGPAFRRHQPRARGSASAIKKRTSHIYIILTDELVGEEKRTRGAKRKTRAGAPAKAPERAVDPEEVDPEEVDAEEEEAPESAGADSQAVEALDESTGNEVEETAPETDERKE